MALVNVVYTCIIICVVLLYRKSNKVHCLTSVVR